MCDKCEKIPKSKETVRKHIQNKHTDLQKPEELCDDESTNSLNISVLSEEKPNTSLPLDNSTFKADTPVKTDMEKSNT